MQILTGQYSKLYTYKYRLTYLDFATAAQGKMVSIVNLPPATNVLFVKVKNKTAWVNGFGDYINFKLHSSLTYYNTVNTAGMFCIWYSYLGLQDQSGMSQAMQLRLWPAAAGIPGQVDVGYLNPTQLVITGQNSNPRFINTYTSGSFDIWITTIRLP
jgi:hypothetical protein